jgi:hypothetical protein
MSDGERPGLRHWLAAAVRQVGTLALLLLLLPWVWALVLVISHHHLDSGAVGILATVSLGLPALVLGWAAYKEATRPALTLTQVADQLAIAVGAQWEAEAAVRRLNDPYPLPVSWDPADPSLTDSWDSLVTLATSGAGWPAPPSVSTWAVGPEGLAGSGGDLVEVLARVPTGRLVVLGEPGAGKTTLMVRLVLDLLARRADGGPLPVLVSVASWNPATQDLRVWLCTQLLINYPALAASPSAIRKEPTQAAALLASGLILPVLDGLDEVSGKVRGLAISRINDALRPGERVVVTCRKQQYRDAVRLQSGIEVTLRGGAAVELCPLDGDTVCHYLCDDAGLFAKARWEPVLTVLGSQAPVGQALTTPLMVALARAIYNPRPGELTGKLREPKELCSPALADRMAVECLLLDAFISAAYRLRPVGRWTAGQAERWLAFIARGLEQHPIGADIAWWRIGKAREAEVRVWLAGLAAGFAGLVAGLAVGFAAGLVAGVGAWIGVSLVAGYLFVAAAAFVGIRGLSPYVDHKTLGLADVAANLVASASPQAVLARDRRAALNRLFAPGLVIGLVAGLVAGVIGLAAGLVAGVIGLAAGLAFGAWVSVTLTAWPSYVVIRWWLALHHQLPWSLMGFLADAHKRGVLRRAGAVYQFRHIELQHRLATRSSTGTAHRWPSTWRSRWCTGSRPEQLPGDSRP